MIKVTGEGAEQMDRALTVSRCSRPLTSMTDVCVSPRVESKRVCSGSAVFITDSTCLLSALRGTPTARPTCR